MTITCVHCDEDVEKDEAGWFHVENQSMFCDGDGSTDLTRQATPAIESEWTTFSESDMYAAYAAGKGDPCGWGYTVEESTRNYALDNYPQNQRMARRMFLRGAEQRGVSE